MGKDPAFLFYPGDWLGGTIGMTLEEKGAYMELLMAQFSRGHMTEHMIQRMVGQNWVTLKDKFQKDAEGNFFNARLEIEIEKRKAFVSSRRNNIKGTNQHTKKEKKEGHTTSHMSNHMENENRNENEYEIINVFQGGAGGKSTPTENYIRMAWIAFRKNKNMADATFGTNEDKAIKEIAKRILSICERTGVNPDEQTIFDTMTGVLTIAYSDKWLKERFLLSNINSQFDALFNKIKKKHDAYSPDYFNFDNK